MKRSGPLRRRSRLAPISDRKREARRAADDTVAAVFTRDRGCLLAGLSNGPCRGRDTPHHLRKQSQGGGWTADNLVTLCVAHNGWVEDNPSDAHALGLVVRAGETTDDAWSRLAAHGLDRRQR